MDKLLIYSGYDDAGPHIFPFDIGGRNGHVKMATEIHPLIEKYMANAKKIPGKTQLLIDAMGAGEWWGSNRNGDYFPHEQLMPGPGIEDYGHKTFMQLAYPFKHHVNKDPKQAYGDKVILSVYHPGMHRVQLIVAVHDDRCKDIIDRVDVGDYPSVSMGCRVPYDQCSICGNKAKNRSQYCDDLKYQMNRILPDGRRVMAINFHPKFFDISFVLIGAEKASYVLKKVASAQSEIFNKSSAELGEKYYSTRYWKGAEFKNADVQKKGTITKTVPMQVTNVEPVVTGAPIVKSIEPELPPAIVNALSGFPLSDILSTLAFLGIDPKPEEFQKIILIKAGHQKLAQQWERERKVFDENDGSEPKDAYRYFDISPDHVNEKIAYMVRSYIPERSCFTHHLVTRLEKYANDDSQWHDTGDSSLLSGIPLAAGIAGLYTYFKSKASKESMTKFEQAIGRHPWLLGLLLATGIGAVGGGINLLRPQPLGASSELDTKLGSVYNRNHDKTASKKILIPLALAPLAYMYSGVQRSRHARGEELGKFDRFIAERPDLAAIVGLIAGPTVVSKGTQLARSIKRLAKTGSLHSDFGIFALTSGSKLVPAALLGAMVDASIIKNISKIVEKRRENGNPQ
jgi:hypothetical protein